MRKNNDEIFNSLEVLEKCAHISPVKAIKVVEAIINTKAPLKPKASFLRGFGKLYGKSHEELIIQCVRILEITRYLETKKVFSILRKLSHHNNPSIKSAAHKVLKELSAYDLFALRQIGYKPQEIILKELIGWSNKKIAENIEILLVILDELLSPDFEGRSNPDYRTITLHSGALNPSEELKTIRNSSLSLLKKAYHQARTLSLKTKVIHVFYGSTQTPHHNLYDDGLEKIIIENTASIIDFYLEILPTAENETIQDIEEQKIWFKKRYQKNLSSNINKLEESINLNLDYQRFRTFVGYDGRLDPDYDFNKDKDTRTKQIEKSIDAVSESTFKDWQGYLLKIVKNYSESDPGGYGYFHSFLEGLGQKKPNLGIRFIKENEKKLSPFLVSLLSGLWKSEAKDEVRKIILDWVKEGKQLPTCALVFSIIGDIDEEIIKAVFNKAKTLKDTQALNNIIRSIVQNYSKNQNLKSILLNSVTELSKNNNSAWINYLWFKSEHFSNFEEKDFDIILSSLLLVDNIGFAAESLLKPIAEKYPTKIIDFFHERVAIKAKKKKKMHDPYDAVPYHLDHVREPLRKAEAILVPKLLSWYKDGGKENNWYFQWEASNLFEKIFPAFSATLEKSLIKLVNKGDEKSRKIIFSVLQKYEGENFLWGLISAIIKKYKGKDSYKEIASHIMGYLSQMGVVSGEDGFVRGYQQKKDQIQKYKKDKVLKDFIREYENSLDKRIIDEQKRTNESIELMKRGVN
jgi:hypothetical protein